MASLFLEETCTHYYYYSSFLASSFSATEAYGSSKEEEEENCPMTRRSHLSFASTIANESRDRIFLLFLLGAHSIYQHKKEGEELLLRWLIVLNSTRNAHVGCASIPRAIPRITG